MLAPPHWHFRDTRERLEAHMGGPQNWDERWLREIGVRPPIFIRWGGGWSDTRMNEVSAGKTCKWFKWADWSLDRCTEIKERIKWPVYYIRQVTVLKHASYRNCVTFLYKVAEDERKPTHTQKERRAQDNGFWWMKNLTYERLYNLKIS